MFVHSAVVHRAVCVLPAGSDLGAAPTDLMVVECRNAESRLTPAARARVSRRVLDLFLELEGRGRERPENNSGHGRELWDTNMGDNP